MLARFYKFSFAIHLIFQRLKYDLYDSSRDKKSKSQGLKWRVVRRDDIIVITRLFFFENR